MYKENPKTKGSGIHCAIPQTDPVCPMKCADCFYQSGRSYLEPLGENLPNMPMRLGDCRVVRINDGLDSNVDRKIVIQAAGMYPMRFYNTSIPKDLEGFDAPVVLTLNPGKQTDKGFHKLQTIPKNLMFVRFRSNTWNRKIRDEAVEFYTSREVPVVLTWMAYHDLESIPSIPKKVTLQTVEESFPDGQTRRVSVPGEGMNMLFHPARHDYVKRKRTSNEYLAIKSTAWRREMYEYWENKFVSSCGKIEGEKGDTHCRFCGVCLREFFATSERLRVVK